MPLKLNGTNSVAAPAYAGDDADTGLQCGTNELNLVTGGTARVKIASDGAVQLLNSTGIDFSGIQTNASGMSSEILDSYEEGTWTPSWVASGTVTTDTAHGNYTKIGDLVFLSFVIGSTGTPTGTDSVKIDGKPFSPDTTTNVVRYQGSFEAIHFTVSSTAEYTLGFTGDGNISIRKMTNTGGNTAAKWNEVSDTSSFDIRGTIVYKVAGI